MQNSRMSHQFAPHVSEVCFANRKVTENQRKVDPNPEKGLGIRQIVHIIILMKALFCIALVLRMGREKASRNVHMY
jgi:hypothetical protein